MTPELTVRRRSALQAAHVLRSSPAMSKKVPGKNSGCRLAMPLLAADFCGELNLGQSSLPNNYKC
eukprot:12921364-Prorocentrum_lima.AAC.1